MSITQKIYDLVSGFSRPRTAEDIVRNNQSTIRDFFSSRRHTSDVLHLGPPEWGVRLCRNKKYTDIGCNLHANKNNPTGEPVSPTHDLPPKFTIYKGKTAAGNHLFDLINQRGLIPTDANVVHWPTDQNGQLFQPTHGEQHNITNIQKTFNGARGGFSTLYPAYIHEKRFSPHVPCADITIGDHTVFLRASSCTVDVPISEARGILLLYGTPVTGGLVWPAVALYRYLKGEAAWYVIEIPPNLPRHDVAMIEAAAYDLSNVGIVWAQHAPQRPSWMPALPA